MYDIIINNEGGLFMGVQVAKYITLPEKHALFEDDGYFIKPFLFYINII